jgi:hypothetical protein
VIPPDSVIVFDGVQENSGGGISYNNLTGGVTFNSPGRYLLIYGLSVTPKFGEQSDVEARQNAVTIPASTYQIQAIPSALIGDTRIYPVSVIINVSGGDGLDIHYVGPGTLTMSNGTFGISGYMTLTQLQ